MNTVTVLTVERGINVTITNFINFASDPVLAFGEDYSRETW